MIKNIRVLCLILGTFFISTHVFATSQIISANSFNQVRQLILHAKNPHHLLVVLDDDDTLTMIPCPNQKSVALCQYLGGPAWFAWQMTLSPSNPQSVGNFSQLLKINTLLLNMSKMPLDDPSIPSALAAAHQVGAHILVATARGYSMLGSTETQFQQDGILNTIEQNALKTPSDHITFPGYYFPKPWGKHAQPRRIAYIDGVLYLSGQNKGVMLQQFLQKMHQTKNITQVIFVDDTFQNVKDVAAAYANISNVNVTSIHFTRLAAHKAALTQGKNAKLFQAAATKQWNQLKTSMKHNLLEPNL